MSGRTRHGPDRLSSATWAIPDPAGLNIEPLADRAILLRFGDRIDASISLRVLAAWRALTQAELPGVVDLVPAYASLTLVYDWQRVPEAGREQPWLWLADAIRRILGTSSHAPMPTGRLIEVPVCYEPAHAPDLADAARLLELTETELVRRHSGADYTVAFLGFRPGFPYLLGMDASLALPRLDTPRLRIAAGSVGIGGNQTGIYPVAGPGGWRLIGRTPLPLFDPDAKPPARLAPGDRLRFVAITNEEFERLQVKQAGPAATEPNACAPSLEVMQPGIHSSFQDRGRAGWRHLGIGAGGASDPNAADLANRLVGNEPGAATLELTLHGPKLRVLVALTIALVGSGMEAEADGKTVPYGRPVDHAAGVRLRFRATGLGARTWIAIAGGFEAPLWLDSASADFGSGLFGRTLTTGDRLTPAEARPVPALPPGVLMRASAWWVHAEAELDTPALLRYLPDREAATSWWDELPSRIWQVGHAADRTGLRLTGEPLSVPAQPRRVSAAVLPGTIQVPTDGYPILLGPDGQTTGGYPVAGHVIETDLPRLAQLKPGDWLRLQPTSLIEAQRARMAQAARIARTHLAIDSRRRRSPT